MSTNQIFLLHVRPTGVSENATFVVDLDVVRFGDLKSNDMGSWNAIETKSTYRIAGSIGGH